MKDERKKLQKKETLSLIKFTGISLSRQHFFLSKFLMITRKLWCCELKKKTKTFFVVLYFLFLRYLGGVWS